MSVPLTNLSLNQSTNESTTRLTKLGNGLRVLTDSNNYGACRMGFIADVGTVDEDLAWSAGINNLLAEMNIKQSKDRNTMQARRIIQWLGGAVDRQVGRDYTLLSGNCLQEHTPALFAVMADGLLEHKATQDILEGQSKVRHHWEDGHYSVDKLSLPDRAFMTAFGKSGQGNHKQGTAALVEELCEEELDLWQDVMQSPNKMVVAGYGVNHEEFVELVDKQLGDRINVDEQQALGNRFKPRDEIQTGGDLRSHIHDSSNTSLFLGFRSSGYNLKQLAASTVVQIMLGEASAFSTGGPGKGMHSILNKLMSSTGQIAEAKAVNIAQKNCGLFGIEATAINNQQAEHTLEALSRTLLELHDKVSDSDLQRAKNLTKVNVAMSQERSRLSIEESLRNILHQDELKTNEQLAMVDRVDKAQIKGFVEMLLSSTPTLCVSGNASSVPSYDKVSNFFGQYKENNKLTFTPEMLK